MQKNSPNIFLDFKSYDSNVKRIMFWVLVIDEALGGGKSADVDFGCSIC